MFAWQRLVKEAYKCLLKIIMKCQESLKTQQFSILLSLDEYLCKIELFRRALKTVTWNRITLDKISNEIKEKFF